MASAHAAASNAPASPEGGLLETPPSSLGGVPGLPSTSPGLPGAPPSTSSPGHDVTQPHTPPLVEEQTSEPTLPSGQIGAMAGSAPHEPGEQTGALGGTHSGCHSQVDSFFTQSVTIVLPVGQTGAISGTAGPHAEGSQRGGEDGGDPHSMSITQPPPLLGSQIEVVAAGGAQAIAGSGRSAQRAGVHLPTNSSVADLGVGLPPPMTEPLHAAARDANRTVVMLKWRIRNLREMGQ
jgi:hypothetical protein